MTHAAVVEDDAQAMAAIAAQLQRSFADAHEEIQIEAFGDAEGLLRTVQAFSHYDVFFLDIEMPGMDGLTLAEAVRKLCPQAILVFISSQAQLVFQSFVVEPFRFIRKEDFFHQAPQLAQDILEKLAHTKSRVIYVTEPATGDIYSFDSLLYVEAQGKDCRIVSKNGETLVRSSLAQLKAQLDGYGCIQCHRSYLVYYRAIYQFGRGEILLTNGAHIPTGRSYAKKARDAFLQALERDV